MKKQFCQEKNENIISIKPFLLEYIHEITKLSKHNSKNQYICPFCNSGTGYNGTGAFTYYPDTHTYNCFACGEHGDIFTLYAKLNNLSLTTDFPQIVDDLKKKFNLLSSQTNKSERSQQDYSQLFTKAEQQLKTRLTRPSE